MSYYSKTTIYMDGGDHRHMQQGEIWHGLTAKDAAPTGIEWFWLQEHDGSQRKSWHFAGADYETFAAARDAYEANHRAAP